MNLKFPINPTSRETGQLLIVEALAGYAAAMEEVD